MIPRALPILLEAVLRALLAACILGAGLRLLRVRNVPAQKVAWGLVLLAALAMPLLMRWQWLPSWAAVKMPAIAWTRTAEPAPSIAPSPAIPVSPSQGSMADPKPAPATRHRLAASASSDSGFTALRSAAPETSPAPAATVVVPAASEPVVKRIIARLLAFSWPLYLGICAALLLRLLFGLISSLRLWMKAEPVAGLRAMEIAGGAPVRSSWQIASPVNIGSGILLPAEFASWDDEKLRVVLAHEQAHIRQRDFYLQLLAGLYAALTWFSPLGWWLKRKLSELGEAISDHAGLEVAGNPSAYAELLLEFAALPRPTVSGVAMANSTNLPQRIKRLLNESSFRQTFAGGRRALATLLVPVVLMVATAMVRVQAATKPSPADSSQTAKPSPDQPTSQAASTGQSNPEPANPEPAPVSDPTSVQTPQPAPAPAALRVPPQQQPAPTPSPAPQAPEAPQGPQAGQEPQSPVAPIAPRGPHVHVDVHIPPMPPMPPVHAYMAGVYEFGNELPYAIVGDPGTKTRFFGDWDADRGAEVEKARKLAQGHFILFRRNGKSYIVDDPTIVNQIETMDKALDSQGDQMRALGKQMRDADQPLRDEMHDQSQQEREAERKARQASAEVPTPDISKEMAELNAAAAALQAKQGGTITREQLQEIQRKISEVQRRVIEAEINMNVKVDFDMSKFNEAQSKMNEQEREIGSKMGQLGAQLGQTARENNEKMKSLIDESLKNGKARPVN